MQAFNDLFKGLFDSEFAYVISVTDFLICLGSALVLGVLLAAAFSYRARFTKSFVMTLALLPAIVCVVIMMVNGNIGAGVAVAGALVGASIVCKWNLKMVRIALGCALFALAIVMACKNAGIGPFGLVGTELGLRGTKLIIGLIVNFFLGALMMVGFGLYIPCTALILLLGMEVGAAFPIMMGSCAFLMVASGFKFVKEGKYDRKAALTLNISGCVGVVIAYVLIKYMFSLKTLTYIICIVMLYTSFTFLRDAIKNKA